MKKFLNNKVSSTIEKKINQAASLYLLIITTESHNFLQRYAQKWLMFKCCLQCYDRAAVKEISQRAI